MSAQGSPYTSGPPQPRGERVPKGANPLRRTSDRFESWFRRFLMLVLLLGMPAAALTAGLTAYESSVRTGHVQGAEQHEVTARLTSSVRAYKEWAKLPAQVRWTDRNGNARTGTALVEPGTPKGAAVRVWVDRDGTLTDPPGTLNAGTTGWVLGGAAAVGVVCACCAAQAGVRLVLDRRRYAQWDAEWELVEPLWSARFRR